MSDASVSGSRPEDAPAPVAAASAVADDAAAAVVVPSVDVAQPPAAADAAVAPSEEPAPVAAAPAQASPAPDAAVPDAVADAAPTATTAAALASPALAAADAAAAAAPAAPAPVTTAAAAPPTPDASRAATVMAVEAGRHRADDKSDAPPVSSPAPVPAAAAAPAPVAAAAFTPAVASPSPAKPTSAVLSILSRSSAAFERQKAAEANAPPPPTAEELKALEEAKAAAKAAEQRTRDLIAENDELRAELAVLEVLDSGNDVSATPDAHTTRDRVVDPARCKAAFDAADADGSGTLDRDELAQVCAALGVVFDDAELDAAMRAIDSDGDRRIRFDEFHRWWSGPTVAAAPKVGVKLLLLRARLAAIAAARGLDHVQQSEGKGSAFAPADKAGAVASASKNGSAASSAAKGDAKGAATATATSTAEDDSAWGRFKAYFCCTGRSKPAVPDTAKPEKKDSGSSGASAPSAGAGAASASPFGASASPFGSGAPADVEEEVLGALSPSPSPPPQSYYDDPNNVQHSVSFVMGDGVPSPTAADAKSNGSGSGNNSSSSSGGASMEWHAYTGFVDDDTVRVLDAQHSAQQTQAVAAAKAEGRVVAPLPASDAFVSFDLQLHDSDGATKLSDHITAKRRVRDFYNSVLVEAALQSGKPAGLPMHVSNVKSGVVRVTIALPPHGTKSRTASAFERIAALIGCDPHTLTRGATLRTDWQYSLGDALAPHATVALCDLPNSRTTVSLCLPRSELSKIDRVLSRAKHTHLFRTATAAAVLRAAVRSSTTVQWGDLRELLSYYRTFAAVPVVAAYLPGGTQAFTATPEAKAADVEAAARNGEPPSTALHISDLSDKPLRQVLASAVARRIVSVSAVKALKSLLCPAVHSVVGVTFWDRKGHAAVATLRNALVFSDWQKLCGLFESALAATAGAGAASATTAQPFLHVDDAKRYHTETSAQAVGASPAAAGPAGDKRWSDWSDALGTALGSGHRLSQIRVWGVAQGAVTALQCVYADSTGTPAIESPLHGTVASPTEQPVVLTIPCGDALAAVVTDADTAAPHRLRAITLVTHFGERLSFAPAPGRAGSAAAAAATSRVVIGVRAHYSDRAHIAALTGTTAASGGHLTSVGAVAHFIPLPASAVPDTATADERLALAGPVLRVTTAPAVAAK